MVCTSLDLFSNSIVCYVEGVTFRLKPHHVAFAVYNNLVFLGVGAAGQVHCLSLELTLFQLSLFQQHQVVLPSSCGSPSRLFILFSALCSISLVFQ